MTIDLTIKYHSLSLSVSRRGGERSALRPSALSFGCEFGFGFGFGFGLGLELTRGARA